MEPSMTTAIARQAGDYQMVARAIRYLEDHCDEQPGLEQVARAVGLSPYHFQRLFTRWAGISPKRFLGALTVAGARRLLEGSESVLETAYAVGLSGPGRLHDLFVTLEAASPGEFKSGGAGLEIRYGHAASLFGTCFIAGTGRGICGLSFPDAQGPDAANEDGRADLRRRWPAAALKPDEGWAAATAAMIFSNPGGDPSEPVRLLVGGTNFQVSVWRALLRIPPGRLSRYGRIAAAVGRPQAARAVGNALAANPVGYLIPCHRVIASTRLFETGYRWGRARKLAMIGREAAMMDDQPGLSSPSTSNMV
jgi:AraC family transcriptional regulator, regulatory protein of adaptative response / methylated-DNA-[protein]-cysteine methyltransferase